MNCPIDNKELFADKAEAHTGYGCKTCKTSWLPQKYIESIKYTNHFEPKEFWLQVAEMEQTTSQYQCPVGCGNLTELEQFSGIHYCHSCSGVLFQSQALKKWLKQYPAKEDPHMPSKTTIGIDFFNFITTLLK